MEAYRWGTGETSRATQGLADDALRAAQQLGYHEAASTTSDCAYWLPAGWENKGVTTVQIKRIHHSQAILKACVLLHDRADKCTGAIVPGLALSGCDCRRNHHFAACARNILSCCPRRWAFWVGACCCLLHTALLLICWPVGDWRPSMCHAADSLVCCKGAWDILGLVVSPCTSTQSSCCYA